MDYKALVSDFLEGGGAVTKVEPKRPERRGRKKCPVVAVRRDVVKEMFEGGKTQKEIARDLNVSPSTIAHDVHFLGLAGPRGRRPAKGTGRNADENRERKADNSVRAVKERRRFKRNIGAAGTYSKVVKPDYEGSIFPDTVHPAQAGVLRDGEHNSKIGGRVTVGPLRGAHIFTVTFEERATCPRSCIHWQGCYGNSMPLAKRSEHGAQAMMVLGDEIAQASAQRETVLVRLHILGDFWSDDYVSFWSNLLDRHDNLHVFGFTAWKRGTVIGEAIDYERRLHGLRFAIRHSETTGEWGAFTLDYPTEQRFIGDALVCPEQRDANEGGRKGVHCGSCGACWQSPRPIAFILH